MDIRLSDVLTSLRAELDVARAQSAGESTRFVVEGIDVEIEVALEHSASAHGGVEFWVVSVGGEGARTSTRTTTLNLHLKVEAAGGERVLTADDVSDLIAPHIEG